MIASVLHHICVNRLFKLLKPDKSTYNRLSNERRVKPCHTPIFDDNSGSSAKNPHIVINGLFSIEQLDDIFIENEKWFFSSKNRFFYTFKIG